MKQRLAFLAAALALTAVMAALPQARQTEPAAFAPVTLAAAADLHYIAPELTDGGAYFTRIVANGDGKAMMYCEEITDAFVAQVVRQKPDALLLAGDLTFNGARASHEAFAAKLQSVEGAGIPVLVIPGNHDLDNTMAAAFHGDAYTPAEGIDAAGFAAIYAAFGYDEALSRDAASLSYTYALAPGLLVLMLDVNTREAPGALTDATFRWVRRQLETARRAGARVLAVSHQDLLAHNSLFSYGYVIDGGERLLALYEEAGVLCSVSGHMHVQHIAESPAGLTEIALSSLVTAPCRYGIVDVGADGAAFRTNEVVFAHAAEAQQFFRDVSYAAAAAELTDADGTLCAFFADINVSYFAGHVDAALWDEALVDAIRGQDTFLGVYLQSIRDDGFRDHTKWPREAA